MSSIYREIINDQMCARLRATKNKPTSSQQAITRIIELLDDLHKATTTPESPDVPRRWADLVTYAIMLALLIDGTTHDQ